MYYSSSEEEHNNNPLNRSLDDQIAEARKRAMQYSQSLKEAREQEAKALKTLEQERDKWAQSFEQKTVMIEQLERELHSAVETLGRQQTHGNPVISAKIPVLDDQTIHQSFKHLLNQSQGVSGVSNVYQAGLTPNAYYAQMAPPSATPSNVAYIPQALPTSATRQQEYIPSSIPVNHLGSVYVQSNNHSVPAPTPIPPPPNQSNLDQQQMWSDLLNQYRDQLQKSKQELEKVMAEKKALTSKIVELNNDVARLQDDKEQLRIANQDLEGKLQFRNKQVSDLEDEKIRREESDRTSNARKEQHEMQVRSLQAQVSILESENKIALQTIGNLEKQLRDIKLNNSHADVRVGDLECSLMEKDARIADLEKKLSSSDEQYARDILELKHIVNSLQIKLTKAEFMQQIPPSAADPMRVSWSDMPMSSAISSSGRYGQFNSSTKNNSSDAGQVSSSSSSSIKYTNSTTNPSAMSAIISNSESAPIFIPPPNINVLLSTAQSNNVQPGESIATKSQVTTPRQQFQETPSVDYLLSQPSALKQTTQELDTSFDHQVLTENTTSDILEINHANDHLLEASNSYTPIVNRSDVLRTSNASSIKEIVGIAAREFSQSESEVELASESEDEEEHHVHYQEPTTSTKKASSHSKAKVSKRSKSEKKVKAVISTPSSSKTLSAPSSTTRKSKASSAGNSSVQRKATQGASGTPSYAKSKSDPQTAQQTHSTPSAPTPKVIPLKTPLAPQNLSSDKKRISVEDEDFVPKVLMMRKDQLSSTPHKAHDTPAHEKVIVKKTMQVVMPTASTTPKTHVSSSSSKSAKKDNTAQKPTVAMHQVLTTQEQEIMSVNSLASLSTNQSRNKQSENAPVSSGKEKKIAAISSSSSAHKLRASSPSLTRLAHSNGKSTHTTHITPKTERRSTKSTPTSSNKRSNSAPPKSRLSS